MDINSAILPKIVVTHNGGHVHIHEHKQLTLLQQIYFQNNLLSWTKYDFIYNNQN